MPVNIDPQPARNFITAITTQLGTNDATPANLQPLIRQYLSDTFTNNNGAWQLSSSLEWVAQNGNAEERGRAQHLLAMLRLTLLSVTPQPPPPNGTSPLSFLNRIVPGVDILANYPPNSVWDHIVNRNGNAFGAFGGTTHTLSGSYLIGMRNLLNTNLPPGATARDTGYHHVREALGNTFGGSNWFSTEELLGCIYHMTTLNPQDRIGYMQGFQQALGDYTTSLPPDQQGAVVCALQSVRDGLNFSGMGPNFQQCASLLINSTYEHLCTQCNIPGVPIPATPINSQFQIHFVEADSPTGAPTLHSNGPGLGSLDSGQVFFHPGQTPQPPPQPQQ